MIKKSSLILLVASSGLSILYAHAETKGAYITGQLGYAQTHMGSKTNIKAINRMLLIPSDGIISVKNSKDTDLANSGLAGRLAIGYQFNANLALEMGYFYIGSKAIDVNAAFRPTPTTLAPPLKNASAQFQQQAIDLMFKGSHALSPNFSLYGKVGVAYLMNELDVLGQNKDTGNHESYDINQRANTFNRYEWAPEIAVGISYALTPAVAIDTSWTHIQTINGTKSAGNIDFAAVGITYHFG